MASSIPIKTMRSSRTIGHIRLNQQMKIVSRRHGFCISSIEEYISMPLASAEEHVDEQSLTDD